VTSEKETVSPAQLAALTALGSGKSLAQAASIAGVTAKTLWAWRSKPAFASELKRLQNAAFQDVLEDLRRVTARAVRVADGLLKAKDERIRLGAVRTVLGVSLELHEGIDLAARVEALEAKARAAEES
jgi:hypothetical protein